MVYVLTLIKALTLSPDPELAVGGYTLCPDQIADYSDDELECRITAVSEDAGIVILVREGSL